MRRKSPHDTIVPSDAVESGIEPPYKDVIEASPAAIIVIQKNRIAFCNQAAVCLFGFDHPQEAIGVDPTALIAPEYHPHLKRRLKRLEDGKPNPPTKFTIVRKDSVHRTVESTSVPFWFNNRPASVIIAQDITERQELELKLRESEERFRAFMDNIPATIYIKDVNDRHIYTNLAGLREVKLTSEEFIDSTTRDLWPPEIAGRLIEIDRKVINEDIPRVTEEWKRTKKGDVRWCKDIKFPIHLESGNKLLGGIALDITDIKRTEQALSEQLEFERLIADIASHLAKAKPEQLDATLNSTIETLGRFLHTERAFLGQFSKDGNRLIFTNVWAVEGISPRSEIFKIDMVSDIPWAIQVIRSGGVINTGAELAGLPDEAKKLRDQLAHDGINSGLVVPIQLRERTIGMLGLDTVNTPRDYPQPIVNCLRVVADMIGVILQRIKAQEKLQRAFNDIKDLKGRLEQENIYLRKQAEPEYWQDKIIGQCKPVMEMLEKARKVAETPSAVLIFGETGTGKDLLAQAIHQLSLRKERIMVKLNCTALPSTLYENELFGREKGAYTGAMTRSIGRFELADQSTLFLDEIGEMPLEIQPKLLRVMQSGEFERLGSHQTLKCDVRIIVATNRNLAKLTKTGKFRKDLYYRLNVFPIEVPPLRDRREDIPLLAWAFVKEFVKTMNKTISHIPKKTMNMLVDYPWPGNIRELRNVIERAMILTTGSKLQIDRLDPMEKESPEALDMQTVEKRHVIKILEMTNWRVRGDLGASEILNLKPSTLESRMKKLGIHRPI